MEIAILLNSLQQPFEEALATVRRLDVKAIQLPVEKDDDPAHCRSRACTVREHGLVISAICANTGDLGSEAPDLDYARELLTIAAEIGSGICMSHIGVVPHTTSGPRWNRYLRHLEELSAHGEKVGACIAIETGPEPPAVLEKLIRTVGGTALRINYDPANLILWPAVLPGDETRMEHAGRTLPPYERAAAWQEFEPQEGVRRLAPFIVHTHAKDAIGNGTWADVPLGEGWIDWDTYLRTLRAVGYDGYLAIEREAGNDRVGDITRAVAFLREQLATLD